MKIYLQKYARFDTLGIYDITSDSLVEMKKGEQEERLTKGFYAFLDNTRILFYGNEKNLFLQVNKNKYLINPGAEIEFRKSKQQTIIIIRDENGKYLEAIEYPSVIIDPPLEAFTMSEEEDFDFGLFLRNVFSDIPRMERLKQNWSSI